MSSEIVKLSLVEGEIKEKQLKLNFLSENVKIRLTIKKF